MCVEIEGRLKSKTEQGKQRFFRFLSRSGDKDNVMVTRNDLSTAQKDFQEKLDELARDLDIDMQRLYDESRPVEMSGSMEAMRPPAVGIFQRERSDISSSGDGNPVNSSDRAISNKSTALKRMVWRIPEVMMLTLIRCLTLMLKAFWDR